MKNMVGRKVGKYKVLAELGIGGMAVVYKAMQESLDRIVAVKELKADFGNDQSLVERFQREALSIAQLGHQNIVHIYDYIEQRGAHFMVMEYVEGIDLAEFILRVGRLPPDIAAIIALHVARALEYAHYRGVVHRDIKPSNVMISKQGEVKLMDFGIARHEQMEDLTLPGTALGTPAYMSPEQIMAQKVDFRSDIFSFGILFYQMLTGQKPFIEDENASVMQRIMVGKYEAPRSVNKDIPRYLQRIVRRCMQNDPDRRYSSTEALRQDIETYVAKNTKTNYDGRLVVFMHNRDMISDSEAETYVRPEMLEDLRLAAVDHNKPQPARHRLLKISATLFGLLVLLSTSALAGLQFGYVPGRYLKWVPGLLSKVQVTSQNGVQVYIDGRAQPLLDTDHGTDFYVLPGTYTFILKHPHCETANITLTTSADKYSLIQKQLKGCKRPKGKK